MRRYADENGTIRYINDKGLLHREDGPAVEYDNNDYTWYKDGKLHRIGGPAMLDGKNEYWLVDGELHREDGPAVIERDNYNNVVEKEWYIKDKRHRLDGPSVEYFNGNKMWCHHGVLKFFKWANYDFYLRLKPNDDESSFIWSFGIIYDVLSLARGRSITPHDI